MFALSKTFHSGNNTQLSSTPTAIGSNTDRLYNNLLWQQWVAADSNDVVFTYDFLDEVPINLLLLFNHNIEATALVCLTLYDSNNVLLYTERWKAGTLDSGFGNMPFGVTGFGGYYVALHPVEPYNNLTKITPTYFAQFATLEIKDSTTPTKIGFLGLGEAFIPKECDITTLKVEYLTQGEQNRTVSGTFFGNPAVSYRRVTLAAKLFNFEDLQHFVETIVDRNTSKLMFFTALSTTDVGIPADLIPLKRVLSFLCYFDKDNYPKYDLGPGKTSEIKLTFSEAL
jgi:hypothetical protein